MLPRPAAAELLAMRRLPLCLLVAWTLFVGPVNGADSPPLVYSEPSQAGQSACVTHSCQLVPEVKQVKKTVYEVREEPYCLKKLPPILGLLHRRCDCCGSCDVCQCVRYRKVLVKKEIVCQEICTSKCVVQEHVQCVPCQPLCK